MRQDAYAAHIRRWFTRAWFYFSCTTRTMVCCVYADGVRVCGFFFGVATYRVPVIIVRVMIFFYVLYTRCVCGMCIACVVGISFFGLGLGL